MKDSIDDNTMIIIHAHGLIRNGLHTLGTSAEYLYETSFILKELQSLSSKPLNIILNSCYSGNIKNEIHNLKDGSSIIVTSKENLPTLGLENV